VYQLTYFLHGTARPSAKIFDPFFGALSGIRGVVVSAANVRVVDEETIAVAPRTTRIRNSNVGGGLLEGAYGRSTPFARRLGRLPRHIS
jgi:hypothetical protein